MKKMIIVSISLICTMIVTDIASMFTRLRQPAQRLATTPGNTRAFSTINTQSRAINDAEKALDKFKEYRKNLALSAKRFEQESSQDIRSMNELPWHKRYFPNFAVARTEKYESAIIEDAKARLADSTAYDLSKIESNFTHALENFKEELATKDKYIAELEKRLGIGKPTQEEEDLALKKYVQSVPLGIWEYRRPYKKSNKNPTINE